MARKYTPATTAVSIGQNSHWTLVTCSRCRQVFLCHKEEDNRFCTDCEKDRPKEGKASSDYFQCEECGPGSQMKTYVFECQVHKQMAINVTGDS